MQYIFTHIWYILSIYNCKLSRKHFILNYIFSQFIYIHKHVYTHTHSHTHTRSLAAGHWPLAATGNWQRQLATGCTFWILRLPGVDCSLIGFNASQPHWPRQQPMPPLSAATAAATVDVNVSVAAASHSCHPFCRLSFAVRTVRSLLSSLIFSARLLCALIALELRFKCSSWRRHDASLSLNSATPLNLPPQSRPRPLAGWALRCNWINTRRQRRC